MLNQYRTQLDSNTLQKFLQTARWFGGKNRTVKNVSIQDWIETAQEEKASWAILWLKVEYEKDAAELYVLPIAELIGDAADTFKLETPSAVLWQGPAKETGAQLICDALFVPGFRSDFISVLKNEIELRGENGKIKLNLSEKNERAFKDLAETFLRGENNSQILKTEQSNSALIYPTKFFLKLIRRCEEGLNPDLEILQYLTEKTSFKNVPQYYGSVEYAENISGNKYSIGVFQNLVKHEKGGWDYTLDLARKSFAENFAENRQALAFAELLGKRTAEMHLALATEKLNPDFAAERFSKTDEVIVGAQFLMQLSTVTLGLIKALPELPSETKLLAEEMLESMELLTNSYTELIQKIGNSMKIRVHGDYHLGQILWTGEDVVILDFEGEPTKSLPERRKKYSPWKDVAGMVRSFHYAIYSVAAEKKSAHEKVFETLEFEGLNAKLEMWYQSMKDQFLKGYTSRLAGNVLLPNQVNQSKLLEYFLVDKAIYELEYELNNRPTWVHIPLLGILSLVRS